MKHRVRWAILGLFALAGPLASTASAMTSTTTGSVSGREIQVSFTFNDTVTCAAGTFVVPTFASILSFESTVRSGGQPTTTLTTILAFGSFSACGSRSEFKVFDGVGALSMNALDSASLT